MSKLDLFMSKQMLNHNDQIANSLEYDENGQLDEQEEEHESYLPSNKQSRFEEIAVKWLSLLSRTNKKPQSLDNRLNSLNASTGITTTNASMSLSVSNKITSLTSISANNSSSSTEETTIATLSSSHRSRLKSQVLINRQMYRQQQMLKNRLSQSDFPIRKDNYLINTINLNQQTKNKQNEHQSVKFSTSRAALLYLTSAATASLNSNKFG